jgi:hypothetical protein
LEASIIISIFASIISGMVLFFLQKYFKKMDVRNDKRDKAKAKENILILKTINSVAKLTEANAIAIIEGKIDGPMHTALENYKAVEKEMYEYLLEQNAQK